jgi:hypothetical protein
MEMENTPAKQEQSEQKPSLSHTFIVNSLQYQMAITASTGCKGLDIALFQEHENGSQFVDLSSLAGSLTGLSIPPARSLRFCPFTLGTVSLNSEHLAACFIKSHSLSPEIGELKLQQDDRLPLTKKRALQI